MPDADERWQESLGERRRGACGDAPPDRCRAEKSLRRGRKKPYDEDRKMGPALPATGQFGSKGSHR